MTEGRAAASQPQTEGFQFGQKIQERKKKQNLWIPRCTHRKIETLEKKKKEQQQQTRLVLCPLHHLASLRHVEILTTSKPAASQIAGRRETVHTSCCRTNCKKRGGGVVGRHPYSGVDIKFCFSFEHYEKHKAGLAESPMVSRLALSFYCTFQTHFCRFLLNTSLWWNQICHQITLFSLTLITQCHLNYQSPKF